MRKPASSSGPLAVGASLLVGLRCCEKQPRRSDCGHYPAEYPACIITKRAARGGLVRCPGRTVNRRRPGRRRCLREGAGPGRGRSRTGARLAGRRTGPQGARLVADMVGSRGGPAPAAAGRGGGALSGARGVDGAHRTHPRPGRYRARQGGHRGAPQWPPGASVRPWRRRGFGPSVAGPGGPDAADYAGDLAALIDHLNLSDVRLVGQSMGGWTVLEYAIAHPAKVKALVLSSTSGTLDRRGCDPSGGGKYDAWLKDAEAKIAAGAAKGIHPAMGAPAAQRSPALHLLYRSIDDMAGIPDKEKVRGGLRRAATRTLADLQDFRVPTLLIAGSEDVVFPPFLASAIAATLPCGEAQMILGAGHSPYFEQAATFNGLVEEFVARQR